MKEVKLKRYAGPFKEIPFDNFIQSPIGLVPKDNGKDCRLIFHLSYPRGTLKLLNAKTPPELCSVKYPDFDKAIQLCLAARVEYKIDRSDFSSAFRHLGIKKDNWKYLIMKACSPLDQQWYYFIDKCLPLGASISCAHFQSFSDAVAHLVKNQTKRDLVNYLDDFLMVALLAFLCNQDLKAFLRICERIKFPVNLDKMFWASSCLVFLGMLINTIHQTVSVPQEKIHKAQILIDRVLSKKCRKITIADLQKICGFLNFLG